MEGKPESQICTARGHDPRASRLPTSYRASAREREMDDSIRAMFPDDDSVLVDEAMLTGESMPLLKQVGSSVYAGTTNQSGALIVRATLTRRALSRNARSTKGGASESCHAAAHSVREPT